jgi:hypothetical protein
MSNTEQMNELLGLTIEATVKGRGASGKKTYLDRFVECLLDGDGNPTEPKTRTEIITDIAWAITKEQFEGTDEEFSTQNPEHVVAFKKLAVKVKHQVAAAVSDSNNSTALSYNEKYKNVWTVERRRRCFFGTD